MIYGLAPTCVEKIHAPVKSRVSVKWRTSRWIYHSLGSDWVLIELCPWFDSDLTTEVGIRNWNCAARCAANWVRIRMEWPGAWLKFDLGTFMSRQRFHFFYLRRAEIKCKVVKNCEIGFVERKIWGTKPCLIFGRKKVDSRRKPSPNSRKFKLEPGKRRQRHVL